MAFQIERDPSVIVQFIDDIQRAADSEKEALGFFPSDAYRQACAQRKLTIAVHRSPQGGPQYAGHIFLGGAYPNARVFQLFVTPAHRKQGLGSRLLRAAIAEAEAASFLTIKAKVASDLLYANKIYEAHGFHVAMVAPGGKSRNRTINVRVRELETPSLFGPKSALPVMKIALASKEERPGQKPLWLIDLNVLFDVIRRRTRAQYADKIVGACLAHDIRLGVTSEFVKELERTSKGEVDPVLWFARSLPLTTDPDPRAVDDLVEKLTPAIFPNQSREGLLSNQDISDVRHIAIAIAVGATGFITNEQAILSARPALLDGHGFDVLGAEEFASWIDPQTATIGTYGLTAHDLQFKTCLLDHGSRELLKRLSMAHLLREFEPTDSLDRGTFWVGAWEGDRQIGLLAYRRPSGPRSASKMMLAVQQDHPSASTTADYLLELGTRAVSRDLPARVHLFEVADHALTRRVALSHGFMGVSGQAYLEKAALGQVVTSNSWGQHRAALERAAGLRLGRAPVRYEGPSTKIELESGSQRALPEIAQAEGLLSPCILLLPERNGAIVPIRREWSEDLIGSTQLSLLPKPEAAFLSRRTYLCSPRLRGIFRPATPIVFYESKKGGGRGMAVAIAVVAHAEIHQKDALSEELKRTAVVEGNAVEKLSASTTILVVSFDNIFQFTRPVPLTLMQELGADDPANFVTSRRFPVETLARLVEAGRPHA